MEAKIQWRIHHGKEFANLYPKAALTEHTEKKGATVEDTVEFIPKVIKQTLWQTEKIAPLLQGKTDYETCRNVWYHIKQNFRYHKDKDGTEEIRSPRRSFHDRFRGIDCDCGTVLACSLLINCGISPKRIILRITKYVIEEDGTSRFQHIYPIVRMDDGSYVTVDFVVNAFDYEKPFIEKRDSMDLQFLDGIDDELEAEELFFTDELGKLKPAKKEKREEKKAHKAEEKKEHPKTHGLHVLNRVNPATVALRNGILASLKLNLLKVASMLKWSYLPEDRVNARGDIDKDRWQKLVQARKKMEKVFYAAGGKEENFRKAILSGKGNKNHEVSGLDEMNGSTRLSELLGEEIWRSENVDGLEGLGNLGDPISAASIGAASGVLAEIKNVLKKIGSIFPKKSKESADFDDADEKGNDAASTTTTSKKGEKKFHLFKKKDKASGDKATPGSSVEDKVKALLPSGNTPADTTATTSNEENTTPEDSTTTTNEETPANTDTDTSGDQNTGNANANNNTQGFWEQNKKWLKPTLIGLTGVGLLYLGYQAFGNKEEKAVPKQLPAPASEPGKPLAGLKSKKRKKTKKEKKVPVALM